MAERMKQDEFWRMVGKIESQRTISLNLNDSAAVAKLLEEWDQDRMRLLAEVGHANGWGTFNVVRKP